MIIFAFLCGLALGGVMSWDKWCWNRDVLMSMQALDHHRDTVRGLGAQAVAIRPPPPPITDGIWPTRES